LSVQFAMPVREDRTVDFIDLGVLTEVVAPDLVEEVIEVAGCRERRRRLLPARSVIYVVLGLCLFSSADGFCPPGYRVVLRAMVTRWKPVFTGRVIASGSAVTRARQRLGAKPLAMLFERVRGPLSGEPAGWSHAFGLLLVAWDGTTVQVADSPANGEQFGYHGQRADRCAPGSLRGGAARGANPLVRVMTLVECGTHAIIDAVFDGAWRASEHVLARQLIAALRPGMLMIADANFAGYQLWGLTAASGAQLLWRVKKNVVFVPLRTLPDGSYLSLMPPPADNRRLGYLRSKGRPAIPDAGHPIRVVEYTVTINTPRGQRTEPFRLITTLLDHRRAPAADLAGIYHQRWQAETTYSNVKPRLIGRDTVLRSRTPDGVIQEIYAFLVIYQALCTLQHRAATTENIDPDRISFLVTIRTVRADLIQYVTPATTATQRQHEVITTILEDRLAQRRSRTSPRQRRPPANKYPSKRRDQPRPSTKATYNIHIDSQHQGQHA